MKQRIDFLFKGVAFVMLAVFFQGFSKLPGGDYYSISLNDKLVIEQFLTQPKEVKPLTLSSANSKDQLVIRFSHCGVSGKGRAISFKDEKGKLLKEWKFTDAKTTGMQFPVKDIIASAGKSGAGFVYYSSKEMPSPKLLTGVRITTAVAAKL